MRSGWCIPASYSVSGEVGEGDEKWCGTAFTGEGVVCLFLTALAQDVAVRSGMLHHEEGGMMSKSFKKRYVDKQTLKVVVPR